MSGLLSHGGFTQEREYGEGIVVVVVSSKSPIDVHSEDIFRLLF